MEEAIDLYFGQEHLESYDCDSCNNRVSATKQISIERAPKSVCIQLKLFDHHGNELARNIPVRQQLNLQNNANETLRYRLVSKVTHVGQSSASGHYTAIGLTQAGNYHLFDDRDVQPIPVQNVVKTSAYLIFYELQKEHPPPPPQQPQEQEQSIIADPICNDGLQLPPQQQPQEQQNHAMEIDDVENFLNTDLIDEYENLGGNKSVSKESSG